MFLLNDIITACRRNHLLVVEFDAPEAIHIDQLRSYETAIQIWQTSTIGRGSGRPAAMTVFNRNTDLPGRQQGFEGRKRTQEFLSIHARSTIHPVSASPQPSEDATRNMCSRRGLWLPQGWGQPCLRSTVTQTKSVHPRNPG